MTTPVADLVAQHVAELREWGRANLVGRVITVASAKGGVGKTFEATEIAYALDAVLIDLDWNDGSVSRALGWFHEQRVRSPLLDALEAGRPPRPITGRSKPDLVPAGPEFGPNQPSAETMRDALRQWAEELGRTLVVDCHPGDGDSAFGAMAAADCIVTPVILGERELDALAGWCRQFAGYPLFVAPNKVPKVPPARQLSRLETIVVEHGIDVATPIPDASWVPRRVARTALLSSRVSARSQKIQTALTAVAREVGKKIV
ncbi:ParA family protein [Skermania sp. ID1734]|uniref:ParA family protein n=1 Tax=Skermania sp. ID1734 TaxID=2597516 RepID=UPI00117CB6AD|nr:ParA family protein [Skermania sp. ID1734]TSD94851.1 ParA family protein [Skermania sp. ID1734]